MGPASETNWTEGFLRDGFCHFPRLVGDELVAAARTSIDGDLRDRYDPARRVEYDNQSFCPELLGTAPIQDLARCAAIQKRLGELIETDEVVCDNGQIAIRRAHNSEITSAPVPHIDGIPTANNGMSGDELRPFTLLLGIFLSEVRTPFAGNFTVWPGSHGLLERYFNRRGRRALREGMPTVSLGPPKQLLCKPGDAVLCHYSLAHAAAVNTSDFDRYAVFFRLTHRALTPEHAIDVRESDWTHLTNIWTDWKIAPELPAAGSRA